ncbi:MAG TPA: hypothetical protein VK559_11060 [Ferruginibacter sp.]|nr:hypothetical protein [Ferruginibacter sp.]
MQTLFIPDLIKINIQDQNGNLFKQENILLGIKTIATHKNDIDLSPFLTDSQGYITITKEQIKNRADIFISYGLMDYVGLEYAKPNIQIYYWGNDNLDKSITHWKQILNNKKNKPQNKNTESIMREFAKQFAEIEIRESEELNLFENSFNLKTKQRQDIILIEDQWDAPIKEKTYTLTLSIG